MKWGSTGGDVARDASNLLRDPRLLGVNCSELVGAVLMQVDLQAPRNTGMAVGEAFARYADYHHRARQGNRDAAASASAGEEPSLRGVSSQEGCSPAHAVSARSCRARHCIAAAGLGDC